MSKLRVLVCGSRYWTNRKFLYDHLDIIRTDISYVIEGDAPGADSMAREWAISRGKKFIPFPADWNKYGKAAGPIRNQQMLDEGKPNRVIFFHENLVESRGTKDMVKRAIAAGIPVFDAVGNTSLE